MVNAVMAYFNLDGVCLDYVVQMHLLGRFT